MASFSRLVGISIWAVLVLCIVVSTPINGATLSVLSLGMGFMYFVYMMTSGRAAHRLQRAMRHSEIDAVDNHKGLSSILMAMALLGVVGLDSAIWRTNVILDDPQFIMFNTLAVGLVTMYGLLRNTYSGLENPARHHILVVAFVVFYLLMCIMALNIFIDGFPMERTWFWNRL